MRNSVQMYVAPHSLTFSVFQFWLITDKQFNSLCIKVSSHSPWELRTTWVTYVMSVILRYLEPLTPFNGSLEGPCSTFLSLFSDGSSTSNSGAWNVPWYCRLLNFIFNPVNRATTAQLTWPPASVPSVAIFTVVPTLCKLWPLLHLCLLFLCFSWLLQSSKNFQLCNPVVTWRTPSCLSEFIFIFPSDPWSTSTPRIFFVTYLLIAFFSPWW